MIFAIDVGNTNIVLGTIEAGKIENVMRIRTDKEATWAEYAIRFKQLLDISSLDAKGFEGAIMSSVAPQLNEPIKQAVKKVTGLDCKVVGPGLKTGMNIRIDDPSTLGADIVVGCVAAMNKYGTPCIVVDMGTATTLVVVDKNRSYLGGAIVPGLILSYRALTAGTSLLPDISIKAPEKVISTNTVDCMNSGAVYGNACLLDGMIDRMEKELGERCTVVATGGIANCVVPSCSHDIIVDNNLLLEGLWIIWQKNRI